MTTFIRLSIVSFIFISFITGCKPETATDDPVGTGQGKVKGMEISQDSAAATKTVTYATDPK